MTGFKVKCGKVKPKLSVVHTNWEPNYTLISRLEDALEYARSGEACSGYFALVCRDNAVITGGDCREGDLFIVTGALNRAIVRLNSDV